MWRCASKRILPLVSPRAVFHSTAGSCQSVRWAHVAPHYNGKFAGDPTCFAFKPGQGGKCWQPRNAPSHGQQIMLLPTRARGYAKATAVPPQFQRSIGMRLYMGSPGLIFEPYRPPPPPLPFLRRWFTKEGWKQRKEWMLNEFKTAYTIARLRKSGYNRAKFYSEAGEIFKQVNCALAQGDRTTLRQLVTESMFSLLKKEIKQREGVWSQILWQSNGPLKRIQTLQGRLAAPDKKNLDNAIVQLTLRIHSNQIFAAYDKQGKVVAGNPTKEMLVEDIWVFEKMISQPDGKWKLCGRIST